MRLCDVGDAGHGGMRHIHASLWYGGPAGSIGEVDGKAGSERLEVVKVTHTCLSLFPQHLHPLCSPAPWVSAKGMGRLQGDGL